MAEHPASAAVQVAACSIMTTHSVNMYHNNTTTDVSLVVNTLDPFLETLRRHPDDTEVQGAVIRTLAQFVRVVRTAGGVLSGVTDGPEFDVLCAVIKPISDADGLVLVMRALRKYQSATIVRSMACWLLAMLCTDAGVTAIVTTTGVPELALASLTHKHDEAHCRYTDALLLGTILAKPAGFHGHW